MEGSAWSAGVSDAWGPSLRTTSTGTSSLSGDGDDDDDGFDAFAAWPTASSDSEEKKQIQRRHEEQRASVKEKRRSIIDGLQSFRIPGGDSSFASEDFSAFSDSEDDKHKNKTLQNFIQPKPRQKQKQTQEESVETLPFQNGRNTKNKVKVIQVKAQQKAHQLLQQEDVKPTSTSTSTMTSGPPLHRSKTYHAPQQTTTTSMSSSIKRSSTSNRRASLGKMVRFQISETKIVTAGQESVASEADEQHNNNSTKTEQQTQPSQTQEELFQQFLFLPSDVKSKTKTTTNKTHKKDPLASSDHKVSTTKQKSTRTKKHKLLRKNSSLSDIRFDHDDHDDGQEVEEKVQVTNTKHKHDNHHHKSSTSHDKGVATDDTNAPVMDLFTGIALHMDHPRSHAAIDTATNNNSKKEHRYSAVSIDTHDRDLLPDASSSSSDKHFQRQNSKEKKDTSSHDNKKAFQRQNSKEKSSGKKSKDKNEGDNKNKNDNDNRRRLLRRNSSLSDMEDVAKRKGKRQQQQQATREQRRMHQSLRDTSTMTGNDDDYLFFDNNNTNTKTAHDESDDRHERGTKTTKQGTKTGDGETMSLSLRNNVDADTKNSSVEEGKSEKRRRDKNKSRRDDEHENNNATPSDTEPSSSTGKSKQSGDNNAQKASDQNNARKAPDRRGVLKRNSSLSDLEELATSRRSKKSQDGNRKSKAHSRLKMHMSLGNFSRSNSNDDDEDETAQQHIGGSLRISSTRMSQSTHEVGESRKGSALERSAKSEHAPSKKTSSSKQRSSRDKQGRKDSTHSDRFEMHQNLHQLKSEHRAIEKKASAEKSSSRRRGSLGGRSEHGNVSRTTTNESSAQSGLDVAGDRSSSKSKSARLQSKTNRSLSGSQRVDESQGPEKVSRRNSLTPDRSQTDRKSSTKVDKSTEKMKQESISRSSSRRSREASSRPHGSSNNDLGRSAASNQRQKRKTSMSNTDTTAATSTTGADKREPEALLSKSDRPLLRRNNSSLNELEHMVQRAEDTSETTGLKLKTRMYMSMSQLDSEPNVGGSEKNRNRGGSKSRKSEKKSRKSVSKRAEGELECGPANASSLALTNGSVSKSGGLDNSKTSRRSRSRSKSQGTSRRRSSAEAKSKSDRGRSSSRHRKSDSMEDSNDRNGVKSRRGSMSKTSERSEGTKKTSSGTRNSKKHSSFRINTESPPDGDLDELEPSMKSFDMLAPSQSQDREDRMYKSMGFLDGGKLERKGSGRSKPRDPRLNDDKKVSEGTQSGERPLLLRTDSDISSLGFSQARKRKSNTKSLDSMEAKASSHLSLEDEDAPIPTAIIIVGDEPSTKDRKDQRKPETKKRWTLEASADSNHSPMMTMHSSFGSLEDLPTREKHHLEDRLNKSLGALNFPSHAISPQYNKIKESFKATDIPAKARSRKFAGAPLTDEKTSNKPSQGGTSTPKWMKRASTHSLLTDFSQIPSREQLMRQSSGAMGTRSIQDNSRKLLLELTEQKMKQEPKEKFWSVLSEAFQPADIDSASYSGV